MTIFGKKTMYKILDPTKNYCLQCGAPIYGRPDKRFCGSGCKNAYHNQENETVRRFHNFILDSLEINYSILKEALRCGISSLPLADICQRGFKPELATYFNRRYNRIDFGIFDIIYNRSDSRITNIHRIGPEIQSFGLTE